MPAELNFFDTYTLMAVQKRIVPKQTFFRDRYFPTEEGDIFSSNKVLTEYMDGDRKMAAFVASCRRNPDGAHGLREPRV